MQSHQRRWDDGTRHPQLQPALSSAGTDEWVLSWRLNEENSGVATGWTGVDMSTPLLLEVAPEIDTNPTIFYRGGWWEVSRSASRPPL